MILRILVVFRVLAVSSPEEFEERYAMLVVNEVLILSN